MAHEDLRMRNNNTYCACVFLSPVQCSSPAVQSSEWRHLQWPVIKVLIHLLKGMAWGCSSCLPVRQCLQTSCCCIVYYNIVPCKFSDSELVMLQTYGHIYGWGYLLLFTQKLQCLQGFQYDNAMRVSKSHKSAKLHTLI